MTRRGVRPRLLATAVCLGLATGCTAAGDDPTALPELTPPPATPTVAEVDRDLDAALSEPVEDSLYPAVGDPGVDVLHYGLDLVWDPRRRRLEGTATLTFRATADAPDFRLDLAGPMRVSTTTLDGADVEAAHRGKDLVVGAPVRADQRYELVVTYAGRPRPVPAPTTRGDFSVTGMTVTAAGELWTMQEPFGAYTWYPVNDQPADKALYDFTVRVPAPWTGVANGRLLERTTEDGTTTTRWQLDEPASSYLTTLAVGDYAHASNTTEDGLRVDYWAPRGITSAFGDMRVAADAVDWIEERLGPYPFSSLGMVMVDSQSAMETQTMVTLGNNDYVRSPAVVVHELVHQWYGDQVSPSDWRDVWLNEGMTMLMQWLWEGDQGDRSLDLLLQQARALDQQLRDDYGPPGAYDRRQFGGSNIYYSPALMWNELREELGDEEFFRVARGWLAAQDNRSTSREELYAHWEAETGKELSAFFDAWIMGRTTPSRGITVR